MTANADANLHPNGLLTSTASTNMPATHQQDSAFLRLPLELRLMIYDYAMVFESLLPRALSLIRFPYDWPDHLEGLIRLCGISRQIRREIHIWLANKECFFELGTTKGWNVLPLDAIKRCPTAFEEGSSGWKDFNLDAPRDLKFWKVWLFYSTGFAGLFLVLIDFKKRRVIELSGHKVDPPDRCEAPLLSWKKT